MYKKNIDKIIRILKKEMKPYKNPIVTELSTRSKDPFIVLISCILSLRTKDDVTAEASKRLFKLADTPYKMVKLNTKTISKAIYPVGFYPTKAKRIKEICKVLIEEYNGEVPTKFEKLLKLKGVGPKTASIVVVYGHGKADFIPVDVHVHVVANRLGWIKTKTAEESMPELMKIIPRKYWYDLNDLLVKFGQNICITVSPWCSKCPVEKFCPKIGVKRHR